MPYGYRLEGTFEDGYVYTENDADVGLDGVHNCAHDLLTGVLEAVHGGLVEFSLIGPELRYDVDMPDGATPVYERRMQMLLIQGGAEDPADEEPRCLMHTIGYRYTDPGGARISHLAEIDG